MTTTGRPLTPPRLRRALVTSVAASMLGMSWLAAALGVALTMFLLALGASGLQIGLAVTVQQIAVVAQIPSSLFAERLKARRRYWGWTAMGHRAVWFLPALLPWLMPNAGPARVWLMLATITVSAVLAHTSSPSWQSWMADLIPPRLSGRFWGIRQTVVMAAYVLTTWAAGHVLDHYPDPQLPGGSFTGFAFVFGVSAVLGCGDIALHLFVPEPRPVVGDGRQPLLERLLILVRDRDLRWLTASLAVWTFSVGLVGSFGIIYLKQVYGATYLQLSALTVAAALGSLIAGIPLGFLIDRVGARSMGTLTMILAPLIGGGVWFFIEGGTVTFHLPLFGLITMPQYMLLITIGNFIGGAIGSGVGLSQMQLITTLTPRSGRMVAIATHWSLIGLLSAAGPIAGGLIMDALVAHPLRWHVPGTGVTLSYLHVQLVLHIALSIFVAAPLLLRVRERGKGFPISLALSALRLGNPMRVLTWMQSTAIPRLLRRPEEE